MVKGKRRIESKSSITASFMCLTRAASYKDSREGYSGPDNIAYELTPGFLKSIIKSRIMFKAFSRRFLAEGIYEYVIARTKYFDQAFKQALDEGFDQIVILGAGFDSRAIRFSQPDTKTKIFEVDAPKTQQEKQMGLCKKNIQTPTNVVYVSVDFDKEQLEGRMREAGFEWGKKTFFTLEGVTMYLTKAGVESTFQFIADASAKGSRIVFDYIYAGVLRGENKFCGDESMAENADKVGEKWQFGLEEGEAEAFVAKYGFTVEDNCAAHGLEERFFKNSKGEVVGKINGSHAIVTAAKFAKSKGI